MTDDEDIYRPTGWNDSTTGMACQTGVYTFTATTNDVERCDASAEDARKEAEIEANRKRTRESWKLTKKSHHFHKGKWGPNRV